MRNRTYGGVRGRKTKVGRKLLRFPPTQFANFQHSRIIPPQQPAPQQKILCKWEMREVIGNICKTFPYIFIVYYFFLLPLVKS